MEIEVINCHDCPLCNEDNEYGYSCNFPNSEVENSEMTKYGSTVIPDKCPLKTKYLKVVYKTH